MTYSDSITFDFSSSQWLHCRLMTEHATVVEWWDHSLILSDNRSPFHNSASVWATSFYAAPSSSTQTAYCCADHCSIMSDQLPTANPNVISVDLYSGITAGLLPCVKCQQQQQIQNMIQHIISWQESVVTRELSYCWDGRAMLHKSILAVECALSLFNAFFVSYLWEYHHKSHIVSK